MNKALWKRTIIALLLPIAIQNPSPAVELVHQPLMPPGPAGGQFKCASMGQPRDVVFLRAETGDSFCIPRQYLRRKDPANATASAVWIEASFPEALPLGAADVFLAAGNVTIVYRFGIPNGHRWLNRLIGEEGDFSGANKSDQQDDPLLASTLEKRLQKDNVVEGLGSYLVDPERIRRYLTKTGRSHDDPYAYSSFDDWHLKRASSGEIVTLIRCAANPPHAPGFAAGQLTERAPPVLLCTHLAFLGKFRDRDIEIRYRKSMLNSWGEIEIMASMLIDKFGAVN